MACTTLPDRREAKLAELAWTFIKGQRKVENPITARQFLNASSAFCRLNSSVRYVEVIISRSDGILALERSVRAADDLDFLTSAVLPLLKHLSDPAVKSLNDGKFLKQTLLAVLVPNSFWNVLLRAHQESMLIDADMEEVFAWLCLEIVNIRDLNLEDHNSQIKVIMKGTSLLNSSSQAVRKIAYRIKKHLQVFTPISAVSGVNTPGGRHDNDFADFRQVSIYPTADELLSTDEPFLQRLNDVFEIPLSQRAQIYRDWLYRLLREDMLSELRDDLQVAMGQKKGNKRLAPLGDLQHAGHDGDECQRIEPFTLNLTCGRGIYPAKTLSQLAMKKYLEREKASFHRQPIGALCHRSEIVAFGSLVRREHQLLKTPPVIGIRFKDAQGVKKALEILSTSQREHLQFFVVNTAMYAYEPILQRLKDMGDLPLERRIINPKDANRNYDMPSALKSFTQSLSNVFEKGGTVKIPPEICHEKDIRLQGAQLESLIHGLKQEVAQIQGPPGTGKSFIGALIILIILRLTKSRVLVLSYTNHATDQFIEDLLGIGVYSHSIVRLGSKSSKATESTLLRNCTGNWLTKEERHIIAQLKKSASQIAAELSAAGSRLSKAVQIGDVLEYLELCEDADDNTFWQAFQVPQSHDGYQVVGPNNRILLPDELFSDWLKGRINHAYGNLITLQGPSAVNVWRLSNRVRAMLFEKWSRAVREEQMSDFVKLSERADELQKDIDSIYAEKDRRILRNRRIIACTTTAAAMYQSTISAANPDIVLVEEAGEILEAHVFAALGPSAKQLILIGDHKQLRPKVNSYKLSKEKGEGYDLNVSLFERLVLQNNHFKTLQEQHRSHPDISQFVRKLAYEGLQDASRTTEREPVRGLDGRVVFVHHEHAEEKNAVTEDWNLVEKASKKNKYEAQMVLKLVKYLGQQGYTSSQMVVLTPYLGQLFLLKEALKNEADPYLNDLDSRDLIQAGLMTEAEAKVNKKALRLSTIDNYQGEESDIVVVSLTRSNDEGNIGFLNARERLVVLMSRARNGMILFGNMLTFKKSRTGGDMWSEFFNDLKQKGCLFDGVPVRCERHPEKPVRILKHPDNFNKYCPDGGCAEPCGTMLNCGKHVCPRHCHRVVSHSKVVCDKPAKQKCRRGHTQMTRCGSPTTACGDCEREDEDARRRIQRDLELEKRRLERLEKYRKELQDVEDQIDSEQRKMKYEAEEKEQKESLQKKQEHLKSLQDTIARKQQAKKQEAKRQSAESSTSQMPKPIVSNHSKTSKEWEAMKHCDGSHSEALDSLMDMIGLESVKKCFLMMKGVVDAKIRQGLPLEGERYSCSLLGNPGTGKTTVARIYGQFLTTVGAISGNVFKEVTGSKLANDGVRGCEKLLEDIKNEGGGVLFIDEAYQLSSGNSPGGAAVLDYLLAEVENLRGKVVFVLAGYNKQMESFFSHNPGFPSRFPITMKFEDYTDEELHRILQQKIHAKYNGRMRIEDGAGGLFFRIASRRIGSIRGKEGFGNARAVENFIQSMTGRQAERLRLSRLAGQSPNDLLLTKEDIIGPEPSGALTQSKAYQDLNKLVGLKEVKDILTVLLDTVKTNYLRELAEEPLVEFSLNRVFLGSPGTGKTSVATLFGRILVDIGLLSNGEVVVKNPADFVGSVLGQSEAQTKGILDATVGKVLVIDEAYGLYGGNNSIADPYKTAVIDTIVAEVQSVPGEDRCVLLLGYQDEMEKMFQNVNPGLSRRFPLSSAFIFTDFSDEDLAEILTRKLQGSGFRATAEGKKVALDVLRRARNRPNFGNAGEVNILLGRAKESHQKRFSKGQTKRPSVLEAVDFDPDFARAETGTDIKELFKADVGRDKLIALLEGYQRRYRDAKALEMDPEIPFNFLFRGPPGTGKTTTARKMGKVYYDMGLLSSTDVIECSATDLIGSYVGQTGPKVQQLFDKALGKILFIDEAYRLDGGSFAKEAVDEIVDCVTKPKYHNKLIIILAGYDKDINSLLSTNPGMSSRFPEVIDFAPLTPIDCVRLLTEKLKEKKSAIEASKKRVFDMECLQIPRRTFLSELQIKFQTLLDQDGWANARDVIHLSTTVFRGVDLSCNPIRLTETDISLAMDSMISERRDRMTNTLDTAALDRTLRLATDAMSPPPAPTTRTGTAIKVEKNYGSDEGPEDPDDHDSSHQQHLAVRDAGVSDEVWEQLQLDREKEEQEEIEYHKLLESQKTASEADRERIVKEILAEEERRKRIEAVKAMLLKAGRCPAGFAWIKQTGGGYRCAGGSHWMSDSEVDKLMQ
ncbi:P-loop containing nucleoside triphosphate hydrolase protein [Mariannaea sp. PMI_226]|nr:P-loop containing nucleoside triphosphate hydrolase protein [Mariannaea sp. PMI_226]